MTKDREDLTVELSGGGKSTGPMSMKQFRDLPKKLREVPLDKLHAAPPYDGVTVPQDPRRRLVDDGDPDAFFIEFPLEEDFKDENREYIIAGEESWGLVAMIGERLCRDRLTHLRGARIGYLWKWHGGEKGGKAVLGKAVRVTAIMRAFTDRQGFVVLSADHVRTFKLTRWQMEALIYHELLHFSYDEGVLSTHGHDFEAFRAEVEAYGLWKPDLKTASDAFKQLELAGT